MGDRNRSIDEGEQVMKAGHVLYCYVKDHNLTNKTFELSAGVLQSSAPKSTPHEVTVSVCAEQPTEAHCSCKAGASGCCKHVTAVMLYANSHPLSSAPPSCTSKAKKWGTMKARLYDEPADLDDLDCVRKVSKPSLLPLNQHETLMQLVNCLPYDCVLKRHIDDTNSCSVNIDDDNSTVINSLIMRTVNGTTVPVYNSEVVDGKVKLRKTDLVKQLTGEDLIFYNSTVALDFDACLKIARAKQLSPEWFVARKARITGTFVHKILRSTDLCKTAETKACEKTFSSAATEYGKANEDCARNEFAVKNNLNVVQTGLLISVREPFLACSPDGVFVASDNSLQLLEIKCPFVCSDVSVYEAIKTKKLKYLVTDGENITLKKNDCTGYYAQVQFALYVLDLDRAAFYVYSPCGSVELRVERDDEFIRDMVCQLKLFYFSHLLPLLHK